MNSTFLDNNFKIEITQDGSPTLRLNGDGESMHHSGGAASETNYIYKSIIDKAYEIQKELKTCVVGLGLGYIEISWALNPNSVPAELTSFEKVEGLSDLFLKWADSAEPSIYDQICNQMSFGTNFDLRHIKNKLRQNFQKQKIEKDLADFKKNQRWNLICYDAFSSKTNQELWSEEFLENFIKSHCEEDCVFTTYACTGILKRVLSRNGFRVIKRLGFQGKREATLALRGIFNREDFLS